MADLEPFDADPRRVAAADALHAAVDHVGDWRDATCACEDDVTVVLKAWGVDQLGARIARQAAAIFDLTRDRDAMQARAAEQLDINTPLLERIKELEHHAAMLRKLVDLASEQRCWVHPDSDENTWHRAMERARALVTGQTEGGGSSTRRAPSRS